MDVTTAYTSKLHFKKLKHRMKKWLKYFLRIIYEEFEGSLLFKRFKIIINNIFKNFNSCYFCMKSMQIQNMLKNSQTIMKFGHKTVTLLSDFSTQVHQMQVMIVKTFKSWRLTSCCLKYINNFMYFKKVVALFIWIRTWLQKL